MLLLGGRNDPVQRLDRRARLPVDLDDDPVTMRDRRVDLDDLRRFMLNGILGAFTGGIKGTAGGVAGAVAFGYLFSLLSKAKTR